MNIMIRTIIIPKDSSFNLHFDFPLDYLGEEIEIIAFKKYEGFAPKNRKPKKFLSFDLIKIDTSHFIFNRNEANER